MLQNNLLVAQNNNRPSFGSDFLSIYPTWGTGTGTFTRASASYITDFEGGTRKIESGCVGIEGSRAVTNLFLNSGATATQNITLGVGRYTLWITGAGSITSSAGTAVGSGFGVATAGTENVITITTPGTVTFTKVGVVATAQVEPNTASTSTTPSEYVATTSVAVSQCFSTNKAGTALPKVGDYLEYQTSHAYAAGTKIQVAGWWYTASAGTSGGTAPTWLTGKAGLVTVTDNDITWTLGGRLLQGYVSEPASTNKVTAYGLIPADTLGSELITVAADRDFSSDTGTWVKSDGSVAISGGTLNFTATPDSGFGAVPTAVSSGKWYRVTWTITNISSGSLQLVVGGDDRGTLQTTAGTYTEDIFVAYTAALNNTYVQAMTAGTTASVDNISVKEITWKTGTKSFHNGTAFVQNITGLTLSGGVAAVLSIVTDETEIAKAGLANINPTYKVYKLVSPTGTTYVDIDGVTGNTNPHSCFTVLRGSGTYYVQFNDADSSVGSSSSYYKLGRSNVTPANASKKVSIKAEGNVTLYFLLPILEEQPFATSINPSLGATSTRAATVLSYPVTGNIPTTGPWTMKIGFISMGVPVAERMIFSSYTDADNYTRFSWTPSTLTFRKRIAGTNYDATKALTIVPNTLYNAVIRRNADGSLDLFCQAAKGTGTADTHTPVLSTAFQVGSSNSVSQFGGWIQGVTIWKKQASDSFCITNSP